MNKEDVLVTMKCIECSVRDASLFKNVEKEQLSDVQNFRKKQIRIPSKSVVFNDGEVHSNVYTLFSGWAAIYKTVNNNGKRQILRFVLPGDLMGYQVDANGAMSHSALAITDCVLCVFQRDSMGQMFNTQTALALRLFEMSSRDMSLCQSHLMSAGRKTAKESVAFLLLELYWRIRLQQPAAFNETTNTVEFPITQEEIGDAVGLTKIHVNRVIQEMVHEYLIICHKKKLTILDEQTLYEISEFNPETIRAKV